MKNILSPIILTALCLVFFSGIYPAAIWGVAQLAPAKGKGITLHSNNKAIGFRNVGQSFTSDNYFWSRPSAMGYNAAGSGGSNKGPTNPAYLADVQARIDTFSAHHPYLQKNKIPVEMITASGSGLDPHISPRAAAVQVKRVAEKTGIDEGIVASLVEKNTEEPLFGLFGPPVVNVLTLNLALSQTKK